jgi:chitodextrinase
VDGAPPTAPANLKGSVKPKSITLTWSASSDNVGVTGYQVYRNSVLLTTVTGLSYKDNTVTRGTVYIYYVKARDAAGNVSGASNSVTVTAR